MTDIIYRSDMTVSLYKTNASDLDVARAAWVSTKGEDAAEADSPRVEGLINYLVKERHGSPLEHNSFTFNVRAPIFVAREFMRHRAGWSYNEESGRYTEMRPEFYVPGRDRNLIQIGKPGHYTFEPGSDKQFEIVSSNIEYTTLVAWTAYESQLKAGVAKEVARMCLPLNIYTSFWATCNARSLMHFLSLRTEHDDATFVSHPQYEIQLVANQMEEEFARVMPITYRAYLNNGRVPA